MAPPDATTLRPLGLGDLLDDLFVLYRRGFWTYVLIEASVIVPLGVLAGPDAATIPTQEFLADATWVPLLAAVSCATSLLYLQQPASLASVTRSLWRQRRSVAGLTLLWLVLVPLYLGCEVYAQSGASPPSLLVGVPIVFVVAAIVAPWSVCVPVSMAEHTGTRAALARSSALIRGARLRAALVLTLVLSLSGPVSMFVMQVLWLGLMYGLSVSGLHVAQEWPVRAVLGTVISVLMAPFLGIGLTLLYYDRRVRAEGYDLIVRARALVSDRDRRATSALDAG